MIRITAYKNGESLGTGSYDQDRVCIGSAEKAHLRVDEEDIAPAHVEVWLENGKCFTRMLSFQMAWVNGEELEEEVELKPGDRLRVSSEIEFTVAYRNPKPETGPQKTTEITFKTYSDILDSDDDAPRAPAPAPARPQPPSQSIPRPKTADKEEDSKVPILTFKNVMIVVVIPLVAIFLFWWNVWPVIKKLNGWK